jgi:hypothetical protein
MLNFKYPVEFDINLKKQLATWHNDCENHYTLRESQLYLQ